MKYETLLAAASRCGISPRSFQAYMRHRKVEKDEKGRYATVEVTALRRDLQARAKEKAAAEKAPRKLRKPSTPPGMSASMPTPSSPAPAEGFVTPPAGSAGLEIPAVYETPEQAAV